MSTKNVKRGFDPDDLKIFSKENIAELKIEGRFFNEQKNNIKRYR